jgi:hypothetical protein
MGIIEEAIRPDRPPRLGILDGGAGPDASLPDLPEKVAASVAATASPPAPAGPTPWQWPSRSSTLTVAGAVVLLFVVVGVALVVIKILFPEPDATDPDPALTAQARKAAERAAVKNPVKSGNSKVEKKDGPGAENRQVSAPNAAARPDAFQFKIFEPPNVEQPKPPPEKGQADAFKLNLFKKTEPDGPKEQPVKPAAEKADALKLNIFQKPDAPKGEKPDAGKPPADKGDALKLDIFKKPPPPKKEAARTPAVPPVFAACKLALSAPPVARTSCWLLMGC